MKIFGVFLVMLFICLYASNLNAEKIYTWTDEKGVKHFSNVPPPDKKLGDLEVRGTEPVEMPVLTDEEARKLKICKELHRQKRELLKFILGKPAAIVSEENIGVQIQLIDMQLRQLNCVAFVRGLSEKYGIKK